MELNGLRHTLDEERKVMAKMMVRLDERALLRKALRREKEASDGGQV